MYGEHLQYLLIDTNYMETPRLIEHQVETFKKSGHLALVPEVTVEQNPDWDIQAAA